MAWWMRTQFVMGISGLTWCPRVKLWSKLKGRVVIYEDSRASHVLRTCAVTHS